MKIQNRENTLSLTGRLDQVEKTEVFGREHLDADILCQVQHHIDDTKRLTGFLMLFMLCPPLSLIQSLERGVLGKKEGVAPLMQIKTVTVQQ